MALFQKIIKEPLVHFFMLGGVLFLIFLIRNPQSMNKKEKIVVERSQIAYLSKRFEVKRGRVPTSEELKLLIDYYVNTEIYSREAIALGLDKNDDVIKKHLRKKMQRMTGDMVSLLKVTDKALHSYINSHPKKFQLPAMYQFEQVYIDPKKHPLIVKEYLQEVKNDLDQNITVASESKMFRAYYPKVSREVLSDIFGDTFYAHLESAALHTWVGPIKTGKGYHFIKVRKCTVKRMAKLSDMRDYILSEYSKEKYRKMQAKKLKILRAKYTIVVEKDSK